MSRSCPAKGAISRTGFSGIEFLKKKAYLHLAYPC
jgi:hypothetical protein